MVAGGATENSAAPGLPFRSRPSSFWLLTCAAKLVAIAPSCASAGSSDCVRNVHQAAERAACIRDRAVGQVLRRRGSRRRARRAQIGDRIFSLGWPAKARCRGCSSSSRCTSGWPLARNTLSPVELGTTCTPTSCERLDTASSRWSSNWLGGWPCELAAVICWFSEAICCGVRVDLRHRVGQLRVDALAQLVVLRARRVQLGRERLRVAHRRLPRGEARSAVCDVLQTA